MPKMEMLREFWDFLKKRKVYWIAPMVIVLLLLGALILLSESTAVAPFVYTLF
jgi:hypothetical protein